MKSNVPLQASIGFTNAAQKVWYAAHVLLAACTSSPAVVVRAATAAVVGKRLVAGYEGFAGFNAKTAAENTTGFAAGAVFPGRPAVTGISASNGYAAVTGIPELLPSPAYAAGVAIPNYPAIPARAEQPLVTPIAALTQISSPAVSAIKGYEDAIEITQSATALTVMADLPIAAGVGIVGSKKLVIGEITPSALQASAWMQDRASTTSKQETTITNTLEQYLYQNALLCNHTIVDIVRNVNGVMINCKRITVTMFPSASFDPASDDLQLSKVLTIAPVVFDPVVSLATAKSANAVIIDVLTNNNGSNPPGLAAIATVIAKPLYQQAVLGGIWFLEPQGEPIGYAGIIPGRSETLEWFESLNLGLGVLTYLDGIPYFELTSM